MSRPLAAIIDYGMGNLFSVRRACEVVGLRAVITDEPSAVGRADAVILPGVGAFHQAMAALRERRLDRAIRDVEAQGKPLMGICLGMQLLMSRSFEFGRHEGLDVIPGEVVRLDEGGPCGRVKVPHVGWNSIHEPPGAATFSCWSGSPLEGLNAGVPMYFVHSYRVVPRDHDVVLAVTTYGPETFCSCLHRGRVFACQFHPERSGPAGLSVYRQWAATWVREESLETLA